jgi:hypothetical protein
MGFKLNRLDILLPVKSRPDSGEIAFRILIPFIPQVEGLQKKWA